MGMVQPEVKEERSNTEKRRLIDRRQGKWTQAECEYAMLLIEHFTSGRLPGCAGGESLRTTLSECLTCTPMRITKKLSSTHAIGKCCFKKKGELTAKERVELEASRARFIASVEKRPARLTAHNLDQQPREPFVDKEAAKQMPRKRTRVDDWLCEDLGDSTWFDDAPPLAETNNNNMRTGGDDDDDDDHTVEGKESASGGVSGKGGLLVKEEEDASARHHHRHHHHHLEGEQKHWLDAPCPHNATLRAPLAPSVSARVNARGRTAIRVVASDRSGLIGDISRALQAKGLSIAGCVAETLPGDVAHDEFDVVDADTKEPVIDEIHLRTIEAYLEETLALVRKDQRQQNSSGSSTGSNKTQQAEELQQQNLFLSQQHQDDADSVNSAPDMASTGAASVNSAKSAPASTSQERRISATTLQVTVPDRPGLLKQITTSLASLSLSIVGAKIETVNSDNSNHYRKTALDTFDVVDAQTGGPVLDPLRLRAIEARLARDLEAHQVVGLSPGGFLTGTSEPPADYYDQRDDRIEEDDDDPSANFPPLQDDTSNEDWLFSRRFNF